jgi:hypothetical protein
MPWLTDPRIRPNRSFRLSPELDFSGSHGQASHPVVTSLTVLLVVVVR